MSKTPRTDSALKLEAFLDGFGTVETVQVEFAEQIETELAEAQKRFTAEDVRQVAKEILANMMEFYSEPNERTRAAESAFVVLFNRLLDEERKR